MAKLNYTVPEGDKLDLLIRDTNAQIEGILGERDRANVKAAELDLSAVVIAWHLGGQLNARKALLGHGNWGQYQRSQDGWPPERTASDYMRIASHFRSAANLPASIRAALAAIRGKAPSKDDKVTLREATREAIDRLWTIDRPRALALLRAWNAASSKAMGLSHREVCRAGRRQGSSRSDPRQGVAPLQPLKTPLYGALPGYPATMRQGQPRQRAA